MATLFNDVGAWREATHWKAIFASPGMNESQTQLFANFGSLLDVDDPSPDRESLVRKVSEQFAVDVYMELKNDIMQAQARASKTSQGNRETSSRPVPLQRTPVVTPHNNARRIVRIGLGRGTTPLRENRSQNF